MKTYKATVSEWRVEVMNALGLKYTIENNMIVCKLVLSGSFVSFLVDQKIKLGIK